MAWIPGFEPGLVRFDSYTPCQITRGGCYVIAKRNTNGVPRHSLKGVSKKFLRMSELYKMFAHSEEETYLDFSDEALLELYNYESYGGQTCHRLNGFMHGKKWLNLNVTMWKEDIEQGYLFLRELYEDPKFPHWWLDGIFKK